MIFPRAAILAVTICAFLAPAAQARQTSLCPDGYEALASHDPERAAGAFEACLSQRLYDWPDEAELRARLGAARLGTGQSEQALLAYNQTLALLEANGGDAGHPLVRRNRALAYLQLDRFEDAVADIELALARTPDDPFALMLAGSAYMELERPEAAVAAFDNALRVDPDYMMAWVGRSAAFIGMDMHEASVSDAREAVAIDPRDATALNALCWALVKAGRASEGLDICDAAVEADPESGAIVHSRAAALEQVGRVDEARELYRRAYELDPGNSEIASDYERTHEG